MPADYKYFKASGTFFDGWALANGTERLPIDDGETIYGGITVVGSPPHPPGIRYVNGGSSGDQSHFIPNPGGGHASGIASDAPITGSWTAPASATHISVSARAGGGNSAYYGIVRPGCPERGDYGDFDMTVAVNGVTIYIHTGTSNVDDPGRGAGGVSLYPVTPGDVVTVTQSIAAASCVIDPVQYSLTGFFTLQEPDGPVCTFEIDPAERTIGRSAQTGLEVAVTASGEECAWSATSNAAWLTVTGGTPGVGSGTLVYSAEVNETGAQRVGTITVAGLTHTVTQRSGKTIAFASVVGAPAPTISPRQRGHTHTQSAPSDAWTIDHNLGHYPSVSAVDGATGSQLEGSVSHPTLNQTLIAFGSARSGTASLT